MNMQPMSACLVLLIFIGMLNHLLQHNESYLHMFVRFGSLVVQLLCDYKIIFYFTLTFK